MAALYDILDTIRSFLDHGGQVIVVIAWVIFLMWALIIERVLYLRTEHRSRLHATLKEKYFLMPEEDKEDALESSRMDVLIANANGIFGVSGHRTVQEFSRFYAYGSGSDYALGALWADYERKGLSALQIARRAIEAAADFDDGTGLPVQAYAVRLR